MKTYSVILSAFIFLFMVGISSAQRAYLKIGDIKGESTAAGHEEWIEVESVYNSLGQQQAITTGASRRRGNVVLGELIVSKDVDKSSPKLLEACASGRAFPELELDMVGSNGRTFYKITMINVRVNRVSTSYNCEPDCKLVDEVSLSASAIRWVHWDRNGSRIIAEYNPERGN